MSERLRATEFDLIPDVLADAQAAATEYTQHPGISDDDYFALAVLEYVLVRADELLAETALGGTYPDPLVIKLPGQPLSNTAPGAGQVLAWDGTQWAPATPASGVTDHGALNGLADDDHTQYVLADGVRNTTNGFAVTGTFGAGTIPVTGAGVRMMWYPGRAAFRAGMRSDEDANKAIATASVALGESGKYSVAMGYQTTASGPGSVALGYRATTEDPDGQHRNGVFVFGDTRPDANPARPTADHQFVVKSAGGLRHFNFHGNSLFSFEPGGTGTGCRIEGGDLNCTGSIIHPRTYL